MVKTPNSSRHSENIFKKVNQDSLKRVLNYTQWAISKFSKTITIPICSQIFVLGAWVDIIKMAYLSSGITEPGLEELQCAGGCRDTDGSWVHVLTCLSIHFVMVPRLLHSLFSLVRVLRACLFFTRVNASTRPGCKLPGFFWFGLRIPRPSLGRVCY